MNASQRVMRSSGRTLFELRQWAHVYRNQELHHIGFLARVVGRYEHSVKLLSSGWGIRTPTLLPGTVIMAMVLTMRTCDVRRWSLFRTSSSASPHADQSHALSSA